MSTRGNGLEAQIIRVEGAVQRVGFRRFAEKVARSSKIAGYVENLKDGSVRIFAQGASEGITQFIDSIKKAPQPIIVDNILTRKATVRSRIKYFRIKTGSLGTEIQEGFGAMESQFGDYRSEFKDYKGEFGDFRSEFKDYRSEFGSFAERTDSNFQSMDKKYGEISARLADILTALQTENAEAIRSLNRSVDLLEKAIEKIPTRADSEDRK